MFIFVVFVVIMAWVTTSSVKMREEEEEIDVALLVVRYVFQIVRLIVYIMKAKKKVGQRKAIGEISIEDDVSLETGGSEEDSESSFSDNRRRSSSGVDDQIRRKTDLMF